LCYKEHIVNIKKGKMMKKIILFCIIGITNNALHSMLITRTTMRTIKPQQIHRNCNTNDQKSSNISPIGLKGLFRIAELNDLSGNKLIESLYESISSPEHSLTQKNSYINSQLVRNDLSSDNRGDLYVMQQIVNRSNYYYSFEAQSRILHFAVKNNKQALVQSTLTFGHKYLVNEPDEHRNTALYNATLRGHTIIAKTLITYGAFLNSKNEKGRTPLHGAVISPFINETTEYNEKILQVIRLLKKAGAKNTIIDDCGMLPIDYVREALEGLDAARKMTLLNEKGDLMVVYHEMENIITDSVKE